MGTFHGHKGAVWSIKVDKLTRTLAATSSGDFSAKLWSVSNGKEIHEFKHKHVVKSIDFTQDTLKIATGSQDGLLRVFDTCQPSASSQDIKVASSISDAISKLYWSSLNTIVIGKKSGAIEVWDIRENNTNPASKVQLEGGEVVIDIELSPDKDSIIAASGKQVKMMIYSKE